MLPKQPLIDAMINRIDELASIRKLTWETQSSPYHNMIESERHRQNELMTQLIIWATVEVARQMGLVAKQVRETFYGFVCATEWRRWGRYVPIERGSVVEQASFGEMDEVSYLGETHMGIIDQDIEMEEGQIEEIRSEGEQLLARMGPKVGMQGKRIKVKGYAREKRTEPMEIDKDLVPLNVEAQGMKNGQRKRKRVPRQVLAQQQVQQARGRGQGPVKRDSGWAGKFGGSPRVDVNKSRWRINKDAEERRQRLALRAARH